jgi:hypothetical protein
MEHNLDLDALQQLPAAEAGALTPECTWTCSWTGVTTY